MVSTAAPYELSTCDLESESETKKQSCIWKQFHCPAYSPWCPQFIYSIITLRYNCTRKYWNIYIPCVSFLLCELLKWATLWNSQSEQSSTLSLTVKQPIRAELNLEQHSETANQSRAEPWAALWNSQSEQSSTLSSTVKQPIRAELNLEPHCETANQSRAQHYYSWPFQIKEITDTFILGTNPRVVNGHVKPFLEKCCPYLSHIFPSISF